MGIPKIEGRALITGASGFIGGRLRDALADRGADVVAVRRKGSPASKRGRSVEVDYDDRPGLERVMREEKPDWVLHVAGATKGVTRDDFFRANVMPTENLLASLREAHPGVKRFVLVSSLAAYGPSTPERHHVETSARRPIELYGESKLAAEHAVEATGDALAWTILRPSGVYGPGDVDYFNLFREIAGGRNVFFGNRDRWFSAVYVDDFVEASLLAMTHDAARGRGYFVCDGQPITWGRFQAAIVEASGRRVLTLSLPETLVDIAAVGGELATKLDGKPRLFNRQKAKMGAQSAWTCDSSAIRSELGFASRVEVHEGVRRAFEWYRREKWL